MTTATTQHRLDSLASLLGAAHDGLLAEAARDPEPDKWYIAAAHLQAAENAIRDAVQAVTR